MEIQIKNKSLFFVGILVLSIMSGTSLSYAQNCPGVENRSVTCVDSLGRMVSESFCNRIGMKPLVSRGCASAQCDNGKGDPLVFDLDGNGISLVNADDGVMFDMDNDGVPDKAGWTDGVDGMLALDDNGNGKIDGQSELFGNMENLGFKHLAQYDSNEDGKITREDQVWKKLNMWVDKNRDGLTDKGELLSMGDLGMDSIDLDYDTVEEINNGNAVTGKGTFTRIVEGIGAVVGSVIETLLSFISG